MSYVSLLSIYSILKPIPKYRKTPLFLYQKKKGKKTPDSHGIRHILAFPLFIPKPNNLFRLTKSPWLWHVSLKAGAATLHTYDISINVRDINGSFHHFLRGSTPEVKRNMKMDWASKPPTSFDRRVGKSAARTRKQLSLVTRELGMPDVIYMY